MTKKWRFVAVGDLHFDKLRNYWPKTHVTLTLRHLVQPVRYAIKKKIRDVILLGDIGDGVLDRTGVYRLTERAQQGLYKFLLKWGARGIRFHIIPGNHDHTQHNSSTLDFIVSLIELGKLPNVFIYTKRTETNLCGVPVEFLPYPETRGHLGTSLCFAHHGVTGALRDNGTREPGSNSPIGMKKRGRIRGRRVYVQGHLHTFHVIRNNLYPGTLAQQSYGEQTEKGWCDCTATVDGKRIHLEYKRVPVVPHTRLSIVEVKNISDLPQGEPDENNIIRLRLGKRAVNNERLLEKIQQLRDSGHRLDVVSATEKKEDADDGTEDASTEASVLTPYAVMTDWLHDHRKEYGARRCKRVKALWKELSKS